MRKRILMVITFAAVLFSAFAVLSASGCGGGGGSGSTVNPDQPSDPTNPTTNNPPAQITDLAIGYGSSFDDITLSWKAPAPASGTAVQSYDVRYGTSSISEGQFTTLPQIAQTLTPKSSGQSESCTFSVSSLASGTFNRGTNIYVSIRSVSNLGATSHISNVVKTLVPWRTKVKASLKSDSTKYTEATFGIQGSATYGLDSSLDAPVPIEYTIPGLLDFYGYLTTSSVNLLVDIHPNFTVDDKWTFKVFGSPSSIIKLQFPSYSANGPYLSGNVSVIEKTTGSPQQSYSVPEAAEAAEFTLDSSGQGVYDIYIY